MAAAGAAIAAHCDLQPGGSPAQRFVRQPTDHRVARDALTAAPVTPLVRFDHHTGQHRPIGIESLPDHRQTQAIKSSESGQIRTVETGRHGSVKHVEVFQMAGVGTFIIGRPRPLTRQRRASRPAVRFYTPNWEEPV